MRDRYRKLTLGHDLLTSAAESVVCEPQSALGLGSFEKDVLIPAKSSSREFRRVHSSHSRKGVIPADTRKGLTFRRHSPILCA